MLYETLGQPFIILSIVLVGIFAGLIFELSKLITFLCNKNKIVGQIGYFLSTTISFLLLFIVNLQVNYGRFRIYILIVFSISLFLERATLGKLWTKLLDKWYNKLKEFRLNRNQANGNSEPK